MECLKMKNIQTQFENHIQYNHIFSNSELEQKPPSTIYRPARQLLIQEGLYQPTKGHNTEPTIILVV